MSRIFSLLFVLFSFSAFSQGMFIKKPPPNYSVLGNVVVVLDATGLENGKTNSYGTVNSDGVLQDWITIAPGSTTNNFQSNAVGGLGGIWFGNISTLKFQDGYIEYPGYVVSTSEDAANIYDFASFNGTFANLDWTVHMVLKIGQDGMENNNWVYSLFGNNAASAGSKGFNTLFEDRASLPRSDGLTSSITRAVGGSFILDGRPDNLITVDEPFVLTVETDNGLAAGDRQKYFINGTQFAHTTTSASTAVVTSPTWQLEIGASGNQTLPFRGWISHFILQSRVESAGTRNAFIADLMNQLRMVNSTPFYNVDESRTYSVLHTTATAGRYYFVEGLLQSPTDPNKIIKIYHEGNAHLYDVDKKIAQQISTDKGRSWGSESTTYDDDAGGAFAVQNSEWGYSADGRLHGISDWHTTIGTTGGTHKLLYHYSDNDGTSYTTSDISSVIPSDGLIAIRSHGNIIENNGFIYACLYKQTDEGDFTQSAQYILRKPIGASTTWTAFTVRAIGSDYRNEMSIAALDASTLMVVSRDEATAEWRQYTGTSDGTSWVDNGALTLGETNSVASPPLLSWFNVTSANSKGEKMIAIWHLNKTTNEVEVTYGKPADLIASGTAGWDTGTKTVVVDDTQIVHYGRVCHFNNTINGIGSFAREPSPFTGLVNTLITFQLPATQYYHVKRELGL